MFIVYKGKFKNQAFSLCLRRLGYMVASYAGGTFKLFLN